VLIDDVRRALTDSTMPRLSTFVSGTNPPSFHAGLTRRRETVNEGTHRRLV